MTGRHTSVGRRHWPGRLAIVLVALGVLGGGAYAARAYLPQDSAIEAACQGSLPVSVVAEPNIAPALAEIVEEHTATARPAVDGTCVDAEVTAVASDDVVAALRGNDIPDLWVSESALWIERVTIGGITLGAPRSIATSPLVVVAPRQVAIEHFGWPDAQFSWTTVVGGDAEATIADPMTKAKGWPPCSPCRPQWATRRRIGSGWCRR